MRPIMGGSKSDLAPLAVTMGEPAGIGGEIALMAWQARRSAGVPPFFMIDDPHRLAELARMLDLSIRIKEITEPTEGLEVFEDSLPVLAHPLAIRCAMGQPDPRNAQVVLQSIQRACELVQDGQAKAVVTNPIHKEVLYAAGFQHPGHTEYLAELAGMDSPPVMMLACPQLRVVPATIHLSLRDAIDQITPELVRHTIQATADALRRDFAIEQPRLAVAGLNPHAGEGGSMGREEIEILRPVIADLQGQGLAVTQPQPADSLFHEAARQGYDAAVCMYHDQALIPIKTLDFEHGVNITLGLPFVRTSPDHGTALNIAGRGEAHPGSLISAIKLAEDMARARARSFS